MYTGADKFSETFLGEFDTPEAIWNSEMRQMMIQKIASHIADFTPRLLSNTRATYQVYKTLYHVVHITFEERLLDALVHNVMI